jgi:hypothetical protein
VNIVADLSFTLKISTMEFISSMFVKGVVSQDLEVCYLVAFDISAVDTNSLNTLIPFRILLFMRLSADNLLCESSWAI